MSYKAALDADARIAARNALKIVAALRQTFDAKAVYEQYLSTQPNKSDNPAQDRARARAWAIMNVTPNMQAMNTVMQRVLAEGYVTGELFADEQLRIARELKKADDAYVDWANWKPGDRAAALLLRPPKAFQQLLQSQGIALKEMSETTTRDIGNAIADAVDLGMSAERSAKNIMRHVANPARALSIAITEQNRAISYATVSRYKEAGLEKMEWEVSSPCDKCAKNANQVVPIGSPFNSGNTQPPAHPHCRCVLLPVIPDFDDPAATGGSITAPVVTPSGGIRQETFTPGVSEGRAAWRDVSPDEWVELQTKRRAALGRKLVILMNYCFKLCGIKLKMP
jgi:SPP1 gp7 family putative phage head morphogenesis protein